MWGQLRRVDLPGGDVIEYAIDGAGRRVGRKKNGAWTARWVYGAGLGPVAELDGDGRVAKRFVYGRHANVPDYVVTLTRTTTTTLESVAAVVHDRRGGVRELIAMRDSLSSVHTTYDEYGRISDPNPVNVGVAVPFGFAGGMFDPETGLVHLGAREYDPQTGRWLTPDPIGFAGGPNLYGYVLADPINYIDPLGHWSAAVEGFVSGFGQGAWDGALGFAEGVVPGLNLSAHMFDSSNPGLEVSRLSGSITRDIEITLAFRGRGFNANTPGRGSWAWNAVRKRLGNVGFAKPGQHVHHWLIPRNGWGKCIPDFIKNRTWNLMPMPSQIFHNAIEGKGLEAMGLLGRLWFGSPTWAKSAGLSIIDIGGQLGAIAYENLKSD